MIALGLAYEELKANSSPVMQDTNRIDLIVHVSMERKLLLTGFGRDFFRVAFRDESIPYDFYDKKEWLRREMQREFGPDYKM